MPTPWPMDARQQGLAKNCALYRLSVTSGSLPTPISNTLSTSVALIDPSYVNSLGSQTYQGEYASQCTELIQYATTDSESCPPRFQLLRGLLRYQTQRYAIPTQSIATVIHGFTPHITTLHFVLIDCTATYGAWDTSATIPYLMIQEYPLSLTELHVTFAYTSPPPALLLDAPRGTIFPPLFAGDLPSACPLLEQVESTAEFGAEDVPENVPEDVRARLVFVCLARTAAWGLAGCGGDTVPVPEPWPKTIGEWRLLSEKRPMAPPPVPVKPEVPVRRRRNSIWRLLKHLFCKS
ncbi:hypothetical protein B0H13DRAFT_2321426 [Mycena leptocephala]|nr:hypothetical protein B0H13DRAFT_2321426 [Mycena leptocephala]